MLEKILGYLIVPVEVMCYKTFFEIFCQSKRKAKFAEVIFFWGIICCLTYFGAIFLEDYFFLKIICIMNTVALLARHYFSRELTYSRSYMLAIICANLLVVADYVTVILDPTMLNERDSGDSLTVEQLLFVLLIRTFLLFIIFLLKILFHRRGFKYLENIQGIKFLIFPIFTISIEIALNSNVAFITNEANKQLSWVLAFGMVAMNIYLFYLIQDTALRERRLQESRIFEIEANNQLKLYETVSNSMEEQRKISHEYQNQLSVIQLLLQKQEWKKLKEYMEQITGNVLQELDYIDTNHIIVNAILNEKYRQALEKNIVMVCKITDLSCICMEDQDIALLLSNLLNNAIEACENCKEKKVIKLKMVYENENVIISIQNTYDGNINFADGEYFTTKEQDYANHGLGIKNVIQVINKYSGLYSIRYTETEFYFSIVIPQETCR